MVADVSSSQSLHDDMARHQTAHGRKPRELLLTKMGALLMVKWVPFAMGLSMLEGQRMIDEIHRGGTPALVQWFHDSSIFGLSISYQPEFDRMFDEDALFL